MDNGDITRADGQRVYRQALLSWPLIVLLIVGAAWYLACYFSLPVLPGADKQWPLGWWGWWDQGCYWRSAKELARFELTPENYHYPLGYPLMGAIFFRVTPLHAFLVPNLLLFLGILLFFHRICREFVSQTEAIALSVVAILLPRTILVDTLVVPWNCIPTHLIIYALIVLIGFRRSGLLRYGIASLLLALVPWFRSGDVLYLLPLFAVDLWTELRSKAPGRCMAKVALTTGLLALSIGGMAALNYAVFGDLTSPYIRQSSTTIGLGVHGCFAKAYSMFVSARPMWNDREPMLLHRFPWMLFSVPGVLFLLKRDGIRHLGWIGAILGCIGFYLTYNDFEAHNIFKYLTFRYWSWWIPIGTLLAYLGLMKSWKVLGVRGLALAVLPCLLFIAVIRQKPVRCIPDETIIEEESPSSARVRLLLSAHQTRPVSQITIPGLALPLENIGTTVIRVNGRQLRPFHDYSSSVRDGSLTIVFRRDIRSDEPILVECDRQPCQQRFRLEPYHLEFGVGLGDIFRTKWKRWFDRPSLPIERDWIR